MIVAKQKGSEHMRPIVSLILILSLAGCAGGYYRAKREMAQPAPRVAAATPAVTTRPSASVTPAPAARPFATGRIQRACMASDRKARSRELCGCIQAVADQTLSGSDQRLAVSFYGDPHRAQDIRQSDRDNHRRFWTKYREYTDGAERTCR
ncbi:MAG: hypothetical protein HLUCCO07_15035 [Rhodobacteraceae bacterium HLUCCO07]|nr:MAG: hypothetical protein HLUCCO07_15035 [Rhodobacteraceae bacterium HLUCCO07]